VLLPNAPDAIRRKNSLKLSVHNFFKKAAFSGQPFLLQFFVIASRDFSAKKSVSVNSFFDFYK